MVHAKDPLLAAAKKGDANAQYELARHYNRNLRSISDMKKVFFWMEKAALQGHTGAQFSVGDMYCGGQGVDQNYIQAYAWHTLAANGGSHGAEEKLEILGELILTEKEIKEALKISAKLKTQIRQEE